MIIINIIIIIIIIINYMLIFDVLYTFLMYVYNVKDLHLWSLLNY